MEGGKLIAHRGAEIVTRGQLADPRFAAPEATDTWKPVSHLELVETLSQVMADRGLYVTREQFAVQGSKFFGVFDTEWQKMEDFGAAVGCRQGIARDVALHIICAARVFVCDNLSFSGSSDGVMTIRKHTSKLNLAEELDRAMYRYMQGFRRLIDDIQIQKDTRLEDRKAKTLIYDIFRQKIMPLRLFHPVTSDYEVRAKVEDPTGWLLHNVCTTHIKTLSPAPAFRATARLGKFLASKF
jgi:hypothetical protein